MVFTKFEQVWTTFFRFRTWPSGLVVGLRSRDRGRSVGSYRRKKLICAEFFSDHFGTKMSGFGALFISTNRSEGYQGPLGHVRRGRRVRDADGSKIWCKWRPIPLERGEKTASTVKI